MSNLDPWLVIVDELAALGRDVAELRRQWAGAAQDTAPTEQPTPEPDKAAQNASG